MIRTAASCYFYAAAIMEVTEEFYSAKLSFQKKSKVTRENVGRSHTFERTPIPGISGTNEDPTGRPAVIAASYKVDLENFENHVCSVPFFGMQH